MPHQPTEDILFFLLDDQNRSYYRNPVTGLVSVTATPTPLNTPPAGFEGQTIQWVRSVLQNGVMTSMTAPFTFKRDGATILRYLYYSKGGIHAYIKLVIQIRDNDNIMRDLYVGKLSLPSMSDVQGAVGEEGVTCDAVRETLNELLAANRSTTYEMSIDVPEAIDVTMDGIELFSEVRSINYQDTQPGPISGVTGVQRFDPVLNIGFSLSQSETTYPSIIWNSQTLYYGSLTRNDLIEDASNEWMFTAEENATLSIYGTLRFLPVAQSFKIGYLCRNYLTGEERYLQLASGGPIDTFVEVLLNDTNLFFRGERVWLIYEQEGFDDTTYVYFSDGLDYDRTNPFSFRYNYRKAETIVKWLPPMYVLSELVRRITRGQYTAYSDLFSNEVANFLITSGDAIRGIENPVLKISLDNLTKSYNVPFPLSVNTFEGRVRIEREDFAYNNTELPHLGEALTLRTSPSQDHLYSKFRFGWPVHEYNDVNGRFEFNTNALWGSVIVEIDKEYDGVSYARADSFGIETTRINLENKETTDSSSDENVFMLDALYTGSNTAVINRPADILVTGIPNANSVFNIRLSPARCARAHGSKIRTALWQQENTMLEYLTKNKNANIVTTENGVVISENGDIEVKSLKAKIYLPVRAAVGIQTTRAIRDYLNDNPGGKLPFTWYVNGVPLELKGYVMQASQEPTYLADQVFDLLLSADVDLKKLIY